MRRHVSSCSRALRQPIGAEEVKRAFNADPREEPVRILLCTDAAREGLNLQSHCADLLHFDLPWNPARLEQRNGRIDRKLQPAPEIRCRYFRYEQRAADIVLDALVRKTGDDPRTARLGRAGDRGTHHQALGGGRHPGAQRDRSRPCHRG
ncbi:helicase-related protein [Methylobacterium oryzae CBMB20]